LECNLKRKDEGNSCDSLPAACWGALPHLRARSRRQLLEHLHPASVHRGVLLIQDGDDMQELRLPLCAQGERALRAGHRDHLGMLCQPGWGRLLPQVQGRALPHWGKVRGIQHPGLPREGQPRAVPQLRLGYSSLYSGFFLSQGGCVETVKNCAKFSDEGR
jgi:hypothetical protein